MDLAKRYGLMELNILGNIKLAEKKGKDSLYELMGRLIAVNFRIIIFKDLVLIFGLMGENM